MDVPERISFPKTEEEILAYWTKIDAFQESYRRSANRPEYAFYDGPPFATGLPHYGHILAGTMKDIVTRYAHNIGYKVTRRFGWDCHGLPIEFEIDKELGIKTREEVLKLGIPKYNAACRSIVMKYSGEWERIVNRLGRWIDFKNDYKTLDPTFMESVWWVFSELYKKGYVYRGFKVMPYSTGCTTPISNFEANLAYKDVDDPAITISFPLLDEADVSLIAWTTTPWTLPSNLALCVNPDLQYVKILDTSKNQKFILCENRLSAYYKDPSGYKVLEKFPGSSLKGRKYKPLFDYFVNSPKVTDGWKVVCDGYVTDESGTGVVHCAPAFGEDDYRVCMAEGIIQKGENIICPVDDNGVFTSEVTDFQGQYVKAADPNIIKKLKEMKRLIVNSKINHSYPFCWRSDTPLLYKAVPSWFVAVEQVKDKLLINNKQSYWVPDYVQEKRFHNWLQDARDWAVSRNRYWGTPLPIWISDDGEEIVVVGSIQELYELSGVKITDLHRENVDHITIPSKKGKGTLKRVEEVFDCWFESGSMPYAQLHYPFENKELFERTFPAEFIAEGIDQTRGWFYTLLVLSTMLFNKPAFKNLIVNGLVLASDGKKMSKRLRNYPDPMVIVNTYGADALRLYLINSPVVRAEALKFQEKGVKDILKDVFLPWYNSVRFFSEALTKFNVHGTWSPDHSLALNSTNIMDRWILTAVNNLILFVREEMKMYRLYTVIPRLVEFIEELTNWFIKLNRKRLKGTGTTKDDTRVALSTLFEVLFLTTKIMAPFTPFLTEFFYQHLKNLLPENERELSVHFLPFPDPIFSSNNDEISYAMKKMQSIVQLGRNARDKRNISLKFPLRKILIISKDEKFLKEVATLKGYFMDELNIKESVFTTDESLVKFVAKPVFSALGPKLGNDLGKVQKQIREMNQDQIKTFLQKGTIEFSGYTITNEDLQVVREFNGDTTKYEAAWDNEVLIVLEIELDEELKQEGIAREIINRVQRLRKRIGLKSTDPVEVFYDVAPSSKLQTVLQTKQDLIVHRYGSPILPFSAKPSYYVEIRFEKTDILGESLNLYVCRLSFVLHEPSLEKKCKSKEQIESLKLYFGIREYFQLLEELKTKGEVTVVLDGTKIDLKFKQDIFPSALDYYQARNK